MVHSGICRHAQPQNTPGVDIRRFAQVGNNGVQGLLDNGILQLLFTAGTALLNNPVDHIRTVADLSVAGGAFRQQLAGSQIRQHHGDGGSADIDGAAHNGGVGGVTDLHAQECIPLQFALDTDSEVVFPQSVGQLHHNGKGNFYVFHVQSALDRPGQALIVGHGVVQGRCFHLHNYGAERISKGNAAAPQVILAVLKNRDLLGRA